MAIWTPRKLQVLTTAPVENENGLIGRWCLDGTGTDWSGNGLNGSTVNGPVFPVSGIIGVGSNFNTTAYYSAKCSNPNIITYSAWVYLTSYSNSTCIFSCGGANQGYQFYVNSSTGKLQLDIQSTIPIGTSSGVVPQNVWSHVAVTYNNVTGVAIFYINGISAGTTTHTYSGGTSTTEYIGNYGSTRQQFLLNDARIYNRALSPGEINAIYNQALAYQQGQPEGEMPALYVAPALRRQREMVIS